MNEQEEIFQAGDQVIRAGLMSLGQVGERIAAKSADKARRAREVDESAARFAERARVAAERAERDQVRQLERAQIAGGRQIDVAIVVARDQVRRDGWWAGADGNRVATQFSLLQQLDGDPRAADARDIMRERIRDLYGIDTDAISAKHPTSPIDQHNALANAIDDWRAAHREDALAEEERTKAAGEGISTGVGAEASQEHQEHQEAAEEHEERADALRSDGANEERQADRFEAEQHHDYTADVATAKGAKTTAAKARAESASGYPRSANQALNDGRKKGAPKTRVNRSRQVKAATELTR
jgi:hypothetical protein